MSISLIGDPYSTNASKLEYKCLLSEVIVGTKFKADIWFFSLAIMSVLGTLVCLLGLAIRFYIPRYAWNFPYYGWYSVKQRDYCSVSDFYNEDPIEDSSDEHYNREEETKGGRLELQN